MSEQEKEINEAIADYKCKIDELEQKIQVLKVKRKVLDKDIRLYEDIQVLAEETVISLENELDYWLREENERF